MDLLYLFRSLIKKRWLIVFFTLLAAALAFAFTYFLKKKVFESKAQYSTGFTMASAAVVKEDFNVFEIDVKFNNVLETFRSPKVIGMLSYNLMLHDLVNPETAFTKKDHKLEAKLKKINPDIENTKTILKNKIDSLQLLGVNSTEQNIRELIKAYKYDDDEIIKNLVINRVQRTDYLDIVFRSGNPYMSAYVTNTLGYEFLRYYNQLSNIRTDESAQTLSTIVQEKGAEVEKKFNELQRTKQSTGAADINITATTALETVRELETKLTDTRINLNRVEAQLSSIDVQLSALGTGGNTSGASNNSEILALKKQIYDLEAENARKGGNDPDILNNIKKLQDQIAAKTRVSGGRNRTDEIRQELLNRKTLLEAERSSALKTMSELETAIRKNKGTASALAGKDVSISRSQAETDIALKEFEALRERQQQALGGGKTPAINFKQTLVGQPALKPEPSGTIMNTLLAAVITFVLSCLVILITEFLNLSLKSPGLFKKILPQQLLASVGRQKLRKKDVFTFFAADQTPKHQKRYGSLISEINKLRFEIEKSGKRILLVTSTQPKQGKSTIVKLLAAAFGKINKKVLVIDANLSNNTLTGGAESVTALETIEVTADVKAEDLVKMAAVTTAENVWLIGCNNTGNAIEEVLPSNHLLKNRDLLLAAFDYVIIEGESLNNHIGSKELSGFADGVVAVFSAKAILKYPDEESINFLNSLDKKYLGNVLNKIEKGDMDI